MWLRCLWARYLPPSLHFSLATAAPSVRLDVVSWACGAPARRAAGVAGAAAWLVRVPSAAFCGGRQHDQYLARLQGDGGHGLATAGCCGGFPQAARQYAWGFERLRDGRSGGLARRRHGGLQLRAAWGRLWLPDRQGGQDRCLCQALLFPLRESLPLTSRGGGGAGAGPAMELVFFVNSTTKTHKLLVAAARHQGNMFLALKQDVSTQRNSSHRTMDSILRKQKTFQNVFWNNSFDDTRRSRLPTESELLSLRLLCALLAPFLDATNVIEGNTYLTASMAHGIVLQLHSDPFGDSLDVKPAFAATCRNAYFPGRALLLSRKGTSMPFIIRIRLMKQWKGNFPTRSNNAQCLMNI